MAPDEPKIKETREYLEAEIRVLEKVGSYNSANLLLSQLKERVIIVVENEMPEDVCRKLNLSEARTNYRRGVAAELENMARYHPSEGSFWESVNDTLKDISAKLKE